MKPFLYVLIIATLYSCQKEYLVQEETTENNIVLNQELTDWVLSISAHDGSFDDILDQSRCFSLLFPYEIIYDGNSRSIQSVNDLLGLEQELVEGIQLPVTITYANYVQETLATSLDLTNARNACQNNIATIESIRCIDFMYPLSMAIFNTDTNTFQTMVVDHDQQTFLSVSTLTSTQRASINFPIQMQLANGNLLELSNITALEQILAEHNEDCQ